MDSFYEAVSRAKSSVILEKKEKVHVCPFSCFLKAGYKNIHSD